MHAAIFAPKIAHLAAQTFARELARLIGLTPARFDLLHAIGLFRTRRQDDLVRMLGVSSSNVARMVKALVQLGLIERTKNRTDGRTWDLALTKAARDLMKAGGKLVMGWAHRLIAQFFFAGVHPVEAMMKLEDTLECYGQAAFGRWMPLIYRYGHPDD